MCTLVKNWVFVQDENFTYSSLGILIVHIPTQTVFSPLNKTPTTPEFSNILQIKIYGFLSASFFWINGILMDLAYQETRTAHVSHCTNHDRNRKACFLNQSLNQISMIFHFHTNKKILRLHHKPTLFHCQAWDYNIWCIHTSSETKHNGYHRL